MNLKPIIQSEVSQKEKYKYCILVHMYGIQKDGTDEIICREPTYGHGGGQEGDGVMYGKSNMEIYNTICEIDSQWKFAA